MKQAAPVTQPKAGRIRMPIQATEHVPRTLQTPLLSHAHGRSPALPQSSTSLHVFTANLGADRACVMWVIPPSAQHRAPLGPSLQALVHDSKKPEGNQWFASRHKRL